MKKMSKIGYILIALCGVLFSTQAYCDSIKPVDVEWLLISDSAQKVVVQDYVNSLDSFAQAMPIIGGDTESTWAADTVHVMAKRVKEGQRSFLESMADIYLMQSYIAYGISYFNAVVGLPHDTQKLCSYVLKDMLASSDSLNQAIIADDYKSVKIWNEIRFNSILNMQLFNTLNGMNSQPPYEDRDLSYSILCQMASDSITGKRVLTDREQFQASCFLEFTAFFKMIVPLIILYDGATGFVEKHKDYITEAAHNFDAKANPVFSLAYYGKEMQFLSDKEFEDYLIKATRYKAGLLRIVTQEMLAMKERRTSN